MKRNPQTKIKMNESTPVMHCRAIRRRKMNGSDDSKAWGVGVTLSRTEKIDMEEMGAISQQRCTVSQTDVIAAWSMLQTIIAEALAKGQRVELGDLGSLSIEVRTKQLKEPGQRLRASDIKVGSISLKPGPLLSAQLNRVKFSIDNEYTEPTDADLLDEALYNYFGVEGKEGINMRRFAILCGYGITRAREIMKEYIAQGVMEHIPMSRGYYRPTKGNYGREG